MSAKLANYTRPMLLLALAATSVSLTSCGSSSPKAAAPPAYTTSSLSGGYVFTAAGTDPTDGDYFVAGTFQADGKGNITGGIADYNLGTGFPLASGLSAGTGVDASVPITGTYTVAALGSGTVSITDGNGVQDTFTIYLANSTSPKGISGVSSFDSTGSGSLVPIGTAPATPAGTYSFSLTGDGHGAVTASGNFTTSTTGAITSGTETYTDGGATSSIAALSGYLLPINNGRGYAVIGANTFSYYIDTLNEITLAGLDDRVLLHGTAQKTN